ncbi:MAG: hypothetical protein QM692_20510 [Thermomicrobiales bacterium]
MTDITPKTWLAEVCTRLSRRQVVAGLLGMTSVAVLHEADAKKKKKKRKKKGKPVHPGPGTVQDCPAGQRDCDGQCRDISTNATHCGGCWMSCNANQICDGGICTVPCSEHACLKEFFTASDSSGSGMTLTADGDIAGLTNGQVTIYSPAGALLRAYGEFGDDDGELQNPTDIATGPDGELLVSDAGNGRIQIISTAGAFTVIPNQQPTALDITPGNRLYGVGSLGYRIDRILSDGQTSYSWGPDGTSQTQFAYAQDLAVDAAGDIYVLEFSTNKVYRFSDNGSGSITVQWVAGGIGVDPGEFIYPTALYIANGRVFVADGNAGAVHVLDAEDGTFLFQFPTTYRSGDSFGAQDLAANTQGRVFLRSGPHYAVYTLKS